MSVRYRILSLDGGGIRGLLASRLLERLVAEKPGWLDRADLIAGTSTGAILAAAVAAGLDSAAISRIYRERGREVFSETLWDVTDVDRLVRADYRNDGLERVLAQTFGERTLGDLERKVIISAFDLDSGGVTSEGVRSWKPKFFHNFEEPESTDRDQRVVDVLMRSCAAPTFFPVYQGFIDGGVVANNPSMCALAQALHSDTGGQHASYISLLSVGTGANPRHLDTEDGDWGYAQWLKPLINIVLEGGSGIADYECRQILGRRYHRLNPVLPHPIALDAVDECPTLEAAARTADLAPTLTWLDSVWPPAE